MKRDWYRALLVLAGIVGNSGCPSSLPNSPAGAIESKYYANGPWPVTVQKGGACCDSSGNHFDLYYPTNLGANGFHHPILTWGNGTNATPSSYDFFLKHMASWGFVIIATEDKNTGPGQTIWDGAEYLISLNGNAASPFYQKLDVTKVGSFGHSQGAAGAINAISKSGGKILTVIPIELPSQIWCGSPASCADTASMTNGSIFLIDGTNDPISPETQPVNIGGEQSIAKYYSDVPAALQKAKGTLKGPSHTDIQGQPSCLSAPPGCINGVYGYLGYPTAWMMDRLQGDPFAHGAFVSPSGEMFSETKNWELVASNIP